MKRFLFTTVIIFFISLISYNYLRHYPVNKKTVIISIPKNLTTREICNYLKIHNIIPSDKILFFLIKISKNEKKLKSGEYIFKKNISYIDILNILVSGKVLLHKVTIPEGLNIYEIAKVLKKNKIIAKEDEFVKFCFSKYRIKNFLNNGFSMEGYLFPDTYKFCKGQSIPQIVKEMNNNFKNKVLHIYEKSSTYFTLNEVIILASIIQKETYNKKEMPKIASVFINRLNKGMRLQSDPTIIYGLWGNIKGRLTKKDLKTYTAYNTYLNYGFPPTPISNPGIRAIKAVLYPAKTNYLYFVATKWGYHVFAKTYKQHLRNIRKYLRIR